MKLYRTGMKLLGFTEEMIDRMRLGQLMDEIDDVINPRKSESVTPISEMMMM